MGGKTKTRHNKQKGLALFLVVVFLFSFLAIATPRPASAQWVVSDIFQKIWSGFEWVYKNLAAGAFKTGVRYMTQQVAHDLAVAAASGGKGQQPLFITEDWGAYLRQVGDAAVGDVIDELVYNWTCEEYTEDVMEDYCTASDVETQECIEWQEDVAGFEAAQKKVGTCKPGTGISLCEADPGVKVNIMVGIQADLGGGAKVKPRCSLSDIKKRFKDVKWFQANVGYDFGDLTPLVSYYASQWSQYEGSGISKPDFLGLGAKSLHDVTITTIPELFSPEASGTGQFITAFLEALKQKVAAEDQGSEEKKDEWQPIKDLITGKTKTPGKTVGATMNLSMEKVFGMDTDTYTGSLAADFVGTFANTFLQKYLTNLLTKGLDSGEGTAGTGVPQYTVGGVAAAKAKFAQFKKPAFSPSGVVNILSELATCPDENPTTNNCVIDGKFEQAIEKKMRLEDAIEGGYIDATKAFGFGIDGRELEYQEGLPYRSIVILRKFSVVPASWEAAARYLAEEGGGNITLQSLIDDFDDPKSAFYGLVDKNWVLTIQENFCNRKGYGSTKAYSDYTDEDGYKQTPNTELIYRLSECVDDRTCIDEEADGSCRAYGYCTKQKAIWRFLGEQCEEQFANCEKYESRLGEVGTYLRDTLDDSYCTDDTVGCRWYCKDGNGEDHWNCYYDSELLCIGGSNHGNACSGDEECPDGVCGNYHQYDESAFVDNLAGLTTQEIAFLDAGVTECSESADGCQQFLNMNNNLASNSSLEYINENTDQPDKECIGGGDAGDPCAENADCVALNCGLIEDTFLGWTKDAGSEAYAVTNNMTDPALDTYSGDTAAYIKGAADSTFSFTVDTGHPLKYRTFTFSVYGRCDAGSGSTIIEIIDGPENRPGKITPVGYESSWNRYSVSYQFPESATETEVKGIIYKPNTCSIVIDAVQIEESAEAGDYADYTDGSYLYLNGDRLACEIEEVGCQLYTPVHGGLDVPGKYYDDDQYTCPEDMVGCKAVEEVAIEPANKVPDPDSPWMTGKRCSNNHDRSCYDSGDCSGAPCLPVVSLIASTGTSCSASYAGCMEYTNLDEVAEGGEGLYYYSFLKQCVFPEDDFVKTYYTWEGDDTNGYQLKEWRLRSFDDSEGGTGDPCTQLEVGEDTPLACLASIDCSAEYGDNPDCRQFFNDGLDVYYRLESLTIPAIDNCHPYRNTVTSQDDIAGNDVYYGTPAYSHSCPASANGCREYRGPSGYNTREVMNDDFEDGTNQGWSNIINSTESVYVDGHSGIATAAEIAKSASDVVEKDKTYMLSFWAKGEVLDPLNGPWIGISDGANSAAFADGDSNTLFPGDFIPTDGQNWHYYTFGPATVEWNLSDPELTMIGLLSDDFWIDNIILTSTTDQFYLIKDSATTCRGEENCEAYLDQDDNEHFIQRFSRLCPDDRVNCQSLFNTQNTYYPYSETFGNAAYNSEITIPEDTYEYWVVDEDNECAESERGCRAVGIPQLSYDLYAEKEVLSGYNTWHAVDDPENYGTTWCNKNELWCEEYTTDDGSIAYFKDPRNRACVYVQPAGADDKNWYKLGYDGIDDYNNALCEVNKSFKQPQAELDTPINWVGICEEAAVGCNAYRDPKDPRHEDLTGGCQPECPVIYDQFGDPMNVRVDGICSYGANQGISCTSDGGCPGGKCIDRCVAMACVGGSNDGQACERVEDCDSGVCGLVSASFPGCLTYTYLKDTVDTAGCYGQVDEQDGCKLLNDASSSSLTYAAEISPDGYSPMYKGYCYQEAGQTLCDTNPGDCYSPCNTDEECDAINSALECVFPGENGEHGSPASCVEGVNPDNGAYCDSNTILKVMPDRICDEWLGCKTAVEVDDKDDLDNDGRKIEKACLAINTCQELGEEGQCTKPVTEEKIEEVGNVTVALSEMQNMSGYVHAGHKYNLGRCSDDPLIFCNNDSECGGTCDFINISGYFPLSAMEEYGLGGATVEDIVYFGDFESNTRARFLVCDSGERESKPCLTDSECRVSDDSQNAICYNPNTVARRRFDVINETTLNPPENINTKPDLVKIVELDNNAALDSNNVLRFVPQAPLVNEPPGATNEDDYLELNLAEQALANNQEYVLSFKGAIDDAPEDPSDAEVTFKFVQLGKCSVSGDQCSHDYMCNLAGAEICQPTWALDLTTPNLTTGMNQYILDPVTVSGADEGAITYLRIQTKSGIGLTLDDVSLKPVLHVQSTDSNPIVSYYDLEWGPTGNTGGLTKYECADWNLLGSKCNIPWTPIGQDSNSINYPMDYFLAVNAPEVYKWEGGVNVPADGNYVFYVHVNDEYQIFVDDLFTPSLSGLKSSPSYGFSNQPKYMTAGWHPFSVVFRNAGSDGGIEVGWKQDGSITPGTCDGGAHAGETCYTHRYCGTANCAGLSGDIYRLYDNLGGANEGTCGGSGQCITRSDCASHNCTTIVDELNGGYDAKIDPAKIISPSSYSEGVEIVLGDALGVYEDPEIDFADIKPTLNSRISKDEHIVAVWEGQIKIQEPGSHTFIIQNDDGVRFYFDDLGTPKIDNWFQGGYSRNTWTDSPGTGWHPFKLEYWQNEGDAQAELRWDTPSGPEEIIPADSLSGPDIATDTYLTRTCRSYPEEDSPSCHYSDDSGVEYTGWRGYCLEPDPVNSDRCLMWWPVDMLSGESLSFGAMEPAGYASSGERSPLFMCLHMGLYEYHPAEYSEVACTCKWKPYLSGLFGDYPASNPCPRGFDPIWGENNKCDNSDDCFWYGLWEDRRWIGCRAQQTGWVAFDGEWTRDPGHSARYINEAIGNRCDYIAKVVGDDGENQAWSKSIQESSGYTVRELGWSYGKDLSPFGSVNALTGDPENWDTDMHCNDANPLYENCTGNEPLYYLCDGTSPDCNGDDFKWGDPGDARSGSPYSCANSDAGGCIGEHDDGTSAQCAEISDQTDCGQVYDCSWEPEGCGGVSKLQECQNYKGNMPACVAAKVCDWDDPNCAPKSVCDIIGNTSQADCLALADLGKNGQGCQWTGQCVDPPGKECTQNNQCSGFVPQCKNFSCSDSGEPIRPGDELTSCYAGVEYYRRNGSQPYEEPKCDVFERAGIGCSWAGSGLCIGGIADCGGQMTAEGCDKVDTYWTPAACSWDTGKDCREKIQPPLLQNSYYPTETYSMGINRLKYLFADVRDVWYWDTKGTPSPADDAYSSSHANALAAKNEWGLDFTSMRGCNDDGTSPRTESYPNDYCYIHPRVFNFKANETESGIVSLGSGGGNVTLKFNIFVDSEQLPLDYFEVDFDGEINRPNQTVTWGGAPKSDPNSPHVVSNFYGCQEKDPDYNWEDDCRDLGVSGGCCIYIPSIKAHDNWDREPDAPNGFYPFGGSVGASYIRVLP